MALKIRIFKKRKRMASPDHTLDVRKFEGDVTNYQAVVLQEGSVLIMSPLAVMTKEQALVHAAWLVVLADESDNYTEFRAALKAVLGA